MELTKDFFVEQGRIGGKRGWRKENRPWRLKQLEAARKAWSKKCSAKAAKATEK